LFDPYSTRDAIESVFVTQAVYSALHSQTVSPQYSSLHYLSTRLYYLPGNCDPIPKALNPRFRPDASLAGTVAGPGVILDALKRSPEISWREEKEMENLEQDYFKSFVTIVTAISSTLDLKQVMGLMTKKLVEVIGLKGAAVRLLNPVERTLNLLASFGLSQSYIRKGTVAADKSLRESMEGKLVIVRNAPEDPRIQYRQQAREEGIGTIVSVPLILKGLTIGVLRLYTSEPREFSTKEICFAKAVADIGAIAIENARMYEALMKEYESVISDLHLLAKEEFWQ
jgi:transcriptional regulator with GAF, ATPase, and Fis domain